MIDQVINELIDEISLEGDQGCTFDQLFTFAENLLIKSLENTKLKTPIRFDDNYKAFIWTRLRSSDQIIFMENDTVIDPSNLAFNEIQSISALGNFVVKATEESQDRNIYGSLKTEKKNLADNHKLILSTVAKSRCQGISQHKMGELLDMDTKAIFYYLKKLDQLGLVVRETAYSDGMNTRIVYLKKFAQKNQEKEDNDEDGGLYIVGKFKTNLIKQLTDAENNMMSLADAINALGFVEQQNIRWARVQITKLHEQGVVEKFAAYDGKKHKQSVRLVRPSETKEIMPKEEKQKHQIKHAQKTKQIDLLYRDLPVDYQFYRDVMASGKTGLVRQDLVDKYPHVDPLLPKLFFENAAAPPKTQECAKHLIYRTEELGGRIRLFRYFALDGWRKFNKTLGKTVTETQVKTKTRAPNLVEPTSIDHIGKAFGVLPSTKISKKRLLRAKNEERKSSMDSALEEEEEESIPKPKKQRATISKSANVDEAHAPQPSQYVNKRITRAQDKTSSTASTSKTSVPPNKRKLSSSDSERADDDTHVEPKVPKVEVPSSALINFDISSSSQSKPKRNRAQATELNSTKLLRRAILLDMMEKRHVRELNQDIVKEFNDIDQTSSGGGKMAAKTFFNMAKQLHEEKKLKVYVSTVQKLHCLSEIRTFVLHSSLSEDSEEVKQFIESYKIEKPMMNGVTKRKEYRKVDVEKLPSVQEQPLSNKENAVVIRSSIEQEFRNYSAEYGWTKSRWLRARELHERLFDHYVLSNREDYIVDMTEFVKYIPLDTLVKICSGLPYHEADFRNFLDVQKNRSMSLNDLPQDIRLIVFQVKAEIRRVINFLLRVLEALGVVKALHEMESENKTAITPRYRLNEEGLIRDYAFKDRAILSTMPLNTVQDVKDFWEELHSACVYPRRLRTDQDEQELQEITNTSDPLCRIHVRRGWLVEVVMKPYQKEILDSFIDPDADTRPSDNVSLRLHLVKQTGLTPKRIRDYYTGVMGAMVKKQTREEKRKAREQRRLAMSSNSTINELMLVSYEKRKVEVAVRDMKQTEMFVQPTFVGSRRYRKLRVKVEPYRADDTEHGYSARAIHNCDPLEKDMIVYSYCIMKARAKGRQFFWSPITKVLTNRTADACRRILNGMTYYEPDILVTIERLKYQWEKYYKEGIANQQIQDERPWDTRDFDLCSYLEYFIIRMQEEEKEASVRTECVLPLKYEDFYGKFNIVRDERRIMKIKKATDNQGISANVFNEDTYDTPSMTTEVKNKESSIQLVMILIKMLLVNPDDSYCSEVAYNVMSKYPTDLIEEAVHNLKRHGLVISDKTRYGRIPGRAFNVSEKFLTIASGVMPFELIDNARSHYSTIAANETVYLKNMELNSGIAASTLDLLSQGKISICMEAKDKYFKSKESLYYPKASAVQLRKAYISKDLDIVIKRNSIFSPVDGDLPITEDVNAKIFLPTPEEIMTYLQKLRLANSFTERVYQVVKNFQEVGATLDEITMCVNESKRNLLNENHIFNAIYDLLNHEPPLIRVVGFEQLRYVTTEFSSNWLLMTDNDKTFLNPLMWNDVSGKVIQSAFDGCAKAVISHILKQPGISYTDLRDKFDGFFTEYELYTLLKYLVDSKTVISRKIQRGPRPKRISIFAKRPLVSSSNKNGLIKCNEITYYWVSNDYYLLKQK